MDPRAYNLYNAHQNKNIMYLMDEFGEQLKDISGKCMDIGCGPGSATKNILLPALNYKAEIIGTDISDIMIKYANKNYSDSKRLKFEILDIETKNLPEKYVSEFDCIFSFHTLHWIQDIRQVLENIYRMLRPGGNTLILFANFHNIFDVFKIMKQDVRFTSYTENTKNFIPFHHPRKELKQLLQHIGFNVYHCSLRERIWVMQKSAEEFLSSVVAFLSFLDEMPHELRQEYKDKFAREYSRKMFHKPTEPSVLDFYEILIAFAQKNIS